MSQKPEHYLPVIIAPKYAVRISDLGPEHALNVTCWKCGHTAIVTTLTLTAKYSVYTRLIELNDKFPCGKCSNRQLNTWQVVRKLSDED